MIFFLDCTRVPNPLTPVPNTHFTAEIQLPVLWPISGLDLVNFLKITEVFLSFANNNSK